MPFLSEKQLAAAGFAHVGKGVQISDKASIYGAEYIAIGDGARIDDFAIISARQAGMSIGRYAHIACATTLIGAGHISLGDFCGLSGHCAVYSSSEDFSSGLLTVPTVPAAVRSVITADVSIGNYVVLGSHCVVLPGVRIGDGAAVGALSLVRKNLEGYKTYAGNPIRFIRERRFDFEQLAAAVHPLL